jgi:hypothetical protein
MSNNVKELEIQDSIFSHIDSAMNIIEDWQHKEKIGRAKYASDLQPVVNCFIPNKDRTQILYDLSKQMEAGTAIAFSSPVTKYKLQLWDEALKVALKLRAPRPRLLRVIIMEIAFVFKEGAQEHTTKTYDVVIQMILALANYETQASMAHHRLLEGKISQEYSAWDRELGKQEKGKESKTGKNRDLLKRG